MSFEKFLPTIRAADPVAAGVVNRPLRQVDQNVRYVYDLIQAAGIGSTVIAPRVSVEAEAALGMPVFYNAAAQRFERGLAVMDSTAGGALRPAPSAQIWGVVFEKHNSTLATILLSGYAALDVSAATGGAVTAGAYYLSGTTAGRLTQQRLPVSVQVLKATGDGHVLVQPQIVDFLDRHVHYKFALACTPAGDVTPPAPGGTHTIDSPDATERGWLPADHGVFAGKAPPQAVFGYNLAADPDLASAWPPIPTSGVYVDFDKGEDETGATGVPLGETGLVVVDRNGIWWTSACYGDVPWAAAFDSSVTESASVSDSGGECPRALHRALTLWFTKMNFATDTTVVTSVRSKSDRLAITCRGTTTPASAGDLDVTLDLNLVVVADKTGATALKTFDPATATFESGPVTEGLYTTGDNVVLEGTATRKLVVADDASPTVHQGLVKVTVLPAGTVELDTQLIRLDGVEEDFRTDPPIMYLAFRAGEDSTLRGRINVPAGVGIASPELALRFQVVGLAAGTLPALAVTARRLPRPADGLAAPEDLPLAAAEFAVTCDFTATLTAGSQYVEVESEPFAVAAGDTVFYSVTRAGSSDGYAADVGVLRQAGVVSAAD